MYEESKYAHGLLMYGYSRLPYQTTTQTDVATDDAVTNLKTSPYLNMTTGTWASDNNPMSRWDACKDGIQYVNLFLTKVEKVQWAPSAKSRNRMFIDRLKGEAFGLRAILYYHLLQAHAGYADDGKLYGVPLLLEPEDASSDFNQPRALFSDCIKRIFEDCDSASNLLPIDYADVSKKEEIPAKYIDDAEPTGYNLVFGGKSQNLISGKVALAVKAQAALLAASPAFREQSGVTPAQAAEICADVLETIKYLDGFDNSGNVDWYSSSYKTKIESTTEIPEIIWREDRHNNNDQERENFAPSLYGNARVNPSQNLVDAFPMLNGLPITDPNSGYDPKNPYANRDPRLANTIICHGATYKKSTISTGVNIPVIVGDRTETDDNLNSIERSTRTGYYLAKLLREDVSVNPSSQLTQKHIYPRIRFTEIFLAFAELANEAWDATGGPYASKGLTAYSVIKAIRERAGLGRDEMGLPLPEGDVYLERCKGNKEMMAQLIRNERRIELCFENKRFWDLRRWMLPLNETVKGMKIERNNDTGELSYTVFDVEERKFDNSYQCYGPIPRGEVLKWSNLQQNKGWK